MSLHLVLILCISYFSVIEVAFSCIVKKIEADYSIRCREGDKEKMIYNYGADLTTSLKLRFDPLNDCTIFRGFVLNRNCPIIKTNLFSVIFAKDNETCIEFSFDVY